MIEQLRPRTAVISSKELMTNCWSSRRFIRGLRCPRVLTCTYPEKKLCRAAGTELAHIREYSKQLIDKIKKNAKDSIQQLENDLKE